MLKAKYEVKAIPQSHLEERDDAEAEHEEAVGALPQPREEPGLAPGGEGLPGEHAVVRRQRGRLGRRVRRHRRRWQEHGERHPG